MMTMKSTPIKTTRVTERRKAYYAALALVNKIEPDPRQSKLARNYRNRAGVLLLTLPEVVDAILSDDLAVAGNAPAGDVGKAA